MKKLQTLCLIVFLTMCLDNSSFAQYSNKKDSTTVIIFNDAPNKKSKKKSNEDNIIKIAPLGFLSGAFPLLYERRVTDFLSIQLGAGLTHHNYVRQLLSGASDPKITYPWPDNNSYIDLAEPIYNFDYRKAKMGYTVSVQPRIYFDNDAMEGGFMGLSFDYYKYNFSIPGAVSKDGSVSFAGADKKESETIKDFMVHFGYQTLYDNITLEYSTAIGLRTINGTKYAAWQDNNGSFMDGLATYKQNPIAFNIGIKVGYHF